jgi:MFS family permease
MGGVTFLSRLPPALRIRDYGLLWLTTLLTGFGLQMVAVAVGWQVYAIHHSAFDLGLIGLAEFVPLPLLALPSGQLADHVSRRLVILISCTLDLVTVLLLLVVTLAGADKLWPFLLLAAATGVSTAVGAPGLRAIAPLLVPAELLPSAMALRSIAFQGATVLGPALGGLLFAIDDASVYVVAAILLVVSIVCAVALRVPPVEEPTQPLGVDSLLAGIRFIRRTEVLLGAISLDLFAVLFGGAVALLPLFARSILHVGPFGLGILRAAPAVGAIAAGVVLTHRPLKGNAGKTLLVVVAIFGASMVVFGLSTSFPLSLAALAVSGFADMYSMNIRGTTVALATPDALRGRVMAVEMVFISASNELGAFESGIAAALLGAVTAVVAGGALTIGLAVIWPLFFPALAAIDRLEELKPLEEVPIT